MLIRIDPAARPEQIHALRNRIRNCGYELRRVSFLPEPIYAATPLEDASPLAAASLDGVAQVLPTAPAELTQRALRPHGTRVRVGAVEIGGDAFAIIAGPCAVENREQLLQTARAVKSAGAHLLRGGAYKPRTSTYSFQGLGRRGLELLAEAREHTGLGVVTEVVSPEDVALVADFADMLQVGARNMQNFALLKQLGRTRKPVLLKRAPGATIAEWLAAAEYLLARGNDQVVLCERGIRTFETYTRNTLDISAVAAVHELTHLPVMVDPSHATGRRSLVNSGCCAALAAGADGICVEVHIRPEESVSDRDQALSPADFESIVAKLRRIAPALGKTLKPPPEIRATVRELPSRALAPEGLQKQPPSRSEHEPATQAVCTL